jgi:hypothetical protein
MLIAQELNNFHEQSLTDRVRATTGSEIAWIVRHIKPRKATWTDKIQNTILEHLPRTLLAINDASPRNEPPWILPANILLHSHCRVQYWRRTFRKNLGEKSACGALVLRCGQHPLFVGKGRGGGEMGTHNNRPRPTANPVISASPLRAAIYNLMPTQLLNRPPLGIIGTSSSTWCTNCQVTLKTWSDSRQA